MAAVVTIPQLEANYNKFIAERPKLSRKYGVAIQSVGGVLADDPGEFHAMSLRGRHHQRRPPAGFPAVLTACRTPAIRTAGWPAPA